MTKQVLGQRQQQLSAVLAPFVVKYGWRSQLVWAQPEETTSGQLEGSLRLGMADTEAIFTVNDDDTVRVHVLGQPDEQDAEIPFREIDEDSIRQSLRLSS